MEERMAAKEEDFKKEHIDIIYVWGELLHDAKVCTNMTVG